MWLRVLAICPLLVAVLVQGLQFKKCCPESEVAFAELFRDNSLSHQKHFNCNKQSVSKIKIKNKRESDIYDSENVTNLSEMISYNLLSDSDSHWPSCSETGYLLSSILSHSLKASVTSSCVDIMNGNYYLFTCEDLSENSEDFKNIYNIKKCCGKEFSFDISSRRCVANNETIENSTELFSFFGNKTVVFEIGIPHCKADDVLIEYKNDWHKLKIYETSLIITATETHGPNVLVHGSYCIENAITLDDNPKIAEQDKTTLNWISKVCRTKDICGEIPCVRKCCKEGLRMVYENGSSFCEAHDRNLQVTFHHFNGEASPEIPEKIVPMEYGILMPKHCDKFMLDREQDVHFISGIDGSLFLPENEEFHSNNGYCVEYFLDKDNPKATVDDIELETFVCFDEKEITETRRKYQIYASLLAVSAVFLAATFLVYIFLPKLLNLHGKTLVSHVFSLFIAYSFLSVVQFGNHNVEELFCKSVAYILLYSFLSAFSWLNVMCLDIFCTICSIRMSHGIRRTKEVRRFIYYSVYAWGFPCLMTIFTYIMDTDAFNFLPMNFKPNIGKSACWFENSSLGHIVFFLIPVGVQISVNIVLFIITAIHCNRVKCEIHRMQMNDNCEQKKKSFLMNLKLFIVMGISWFLEILATLFDKNPTWWLISDGFNLLQGVLVFFIFVFKRSVLVAFKKKLGIRSFGLRPKTPNSTSTNTNMSTLDLNSTGNLKYNSKMLKSNSSSTLTNANVIRS